MLTRELMKITKEYQIITQKYELAREDSITLESLNTNLQEFENFLIASLHELFGDNNSMWNPSIMISKSKINKSSSLKMLDFRKLKATLMASNDANYISAVIEALRWRITRAGNAMHRREAVIQYGNCDLIDYTFFDHLIEKKRKTIYESVVALINSMASDYFGRSYLIANEPLINYLILILKSENKETYTRKNCLGILQKLSLRKRPQEILINNDIIKWVVATLINEKDTLSEYALEYLTALLLNLSLRTIGKDKIEEIKFKVLNLLLDLLEHPNENIQCYVNGTLYSIFTRPSVKKLALEMGFHSKFKELMSIADENLQKRYEYVLSQLQSEVTDENLSELNEDEQDVELAEDDDSWCDDEIENAPEVEFDVRGEDLLALFKLEGDEADRVS